MFQLICIDAGHVTENALLFAIKVIYFVSETILSITFNLEGFLWMWPKERRRIVCIERSGADSDLSVIGLHWFESLVCYLL